MKDIRYYELSFPKGLNLDLLEKILPEEKFMEFILKYSGEQRFRRRIILPSHQCLKKVFCHYLWKLIKEKRITWEEVKADFKDEIKTLKFLDLTKYEVERLYKQRKIEILKEVK